ncbi:HDOD domain-containing protein [Alteromonas gilva]|uniref:HDOD domain-containing protein n=1 Tax=Alteromonas gilva TaxID=2987522 RepID=A0ABT5KZJ5_9ALTE|nr:HDOD domain-containing protein [Alteromonas gilva]MDC8830189.1 HDOD domain-containing protein [Alteromonas gilva]
MKQYIQYATKSFTLPDICTRLRGVLDDPRSDAEDIANLISVDPSMTAKLLRLANSSLFRFPSQIESITKAVSIIGGEALYNLVIAETANIAFKHFDNECLSLDKHWEQSVYTGMVAKYLAREMNLRGSDRFFVMGILQNLSELVIAKHEPAKYQQYSKDDNPLPPWERQISHFGFYFSECSGAIMEHWQLPMPLFYPVKHAHNKAKLASDLDVSLLTCAIRLATFHYQREQYPGLDIISPDMTRLMPLEEEVLHNAILFAQKETNKVSMSVL